MTRKRNVTHCPDGHPYSAENTYRNTRGHRICKKCLTRQQKEYRERRATPATRAATLDRQAERERADRALARLVDR